jgi:hypothetical protein
MMPIHHVWASDYHSSRKRRHLIGLYFVLLLPVSVCFSFSSNNNNNKNKPPPRLTPDELQKKYVEEDGISIEWEKLG